MSTLSTRADALDLFLDADPDDIAIFDWLVEHGGDATPGPSGFDAPDGWRVEMLGITRSDETLWGACRDWISAARRQIEGRAVFAGIVTVAPDFRALAGRGAL